MEPDGGADQTEVKVRFVTTDDEFQLPENKRQLVVPADLRRYGLSQILNSQAMLATASPVPFDFLINGSFLRSTIQEYLSANGLTAETTLTLQYVRATLPPTHEASVEQDDWVGCVDLMSETAPGWIAGAASTTGTDADRILSAGFDGHLRMYNRALQVVATTKTAAARVRGTPLHAARFITPDRVAASGDGRTVRVWDYKESRRAAGGDEDVPGEFKLSLELHGHLATVNSIEVDYKSQRLLTASDDGRVGLWATRKDDTAPDVDQDLVSDRSGTKRLKSSSTSSSGARQRGPLAMFSPHHAGSRDEGVVLANARAIHSAVFHPGDATVAYSAGDDHAVRTIDLTTGRVVSSIETRSALLCLAALPSPTASSSSSSSSSPLLAAGRDDDCAIVLLDPRVTATHPAVLTLRGHMRWVTSLAAAPAAGHHQQQLVSAGYDGTVRLWDLRNSRTETEVVDAGSRRVGDPLWVIRREGWETPKERKRRVAAGEDEPRLFSVAWDRSWGIVSGGSDRKIQINRVPES